MKACVVLASALLLAACATTTPATTSSSPAVHPETRMPESVERIPQSTPQGSLVIGRVAPGSRVWLKDLLPPGAIPIRTPYTQLRVSSDGYFVFGVGRDETETRSVLVAPPRAGDTAAFNPVAPLTPDAVPHAIVVVPRKFTIENITGVPENTVNPPPAIAARIEHEQGDVGIARERNDDRDDFSHGFDWPVHGRISGQYGSQRIYNGTPKSWHSGMDVAAPKGTPVHAPAGGIVIFANPDLYLTGGTVLIDHGQGVSSNFLHMSRIDVKVGDRVEQGQVIGLVGATGRATGPHMHWGMNWLTVRVDPQLLVQPAAPAESK
ncbi:MAG: M23 family metallopeptidase [Lysobacteraceae bacterium]